MAVVLLLTVLGSSFKTPEEMADTDPLVLPYVTVYRRIILPLMKPRSPRC